MKFNRVKKLIKRALYGEKNNVIIKDSEWIKKLSYKYYLKTKRSLSKKIITDIEKQSTLPQISHAIACAIDKLSKKKTYTFQSMLVIVNPYQYAPLCALAIFRTKKEYCVLVTINGKTDDTDIQYTLSKSKVHKIPIM